MGRGARPRRRPRGGVAIPPPRARRSRLIAGAAAIAPLAAVGAYSALAGSRLVPLVVGLAAAGCAVVAVALVFRLAVLVPWGVALAGAAYAVFLRLRGGSVDSRSVYVAAAIVASAEAAFLSLRPPVAAADARARWDGVARLAAIVFATLLGGGVVLAASGTAGGGLVLEGVGVAAAVVAVAAAVILGARTSDAASRRR